MSKKSSENYTTITETPGVGASQEQLSMLYTRYKFAANYCKGKDVLEVACGAGQGLGYLARIANKVVGGDIDEKNLNFAKNHYKGRSNIEICKLDAHKMSFEDKSFDTIILYEAIYYLKNPEQFLRECRRLLRPKGTLIICSVNKEWAEFNPSPFSVRYFSLSELSDITRKFGFLAEGFGAFPVSKDSLKDSLISLIKRTAVRSGLMPKTMRGKQLLKRIFLGRLTSLPYEVSDDMGDYSPPMPLDLNKTQSLYKVLYTVGKL